MQTYIRRQSYGQRPDGIRAFVPYHIFGINIP